MCGIVGSIGGRPAAPILLDGLRRLEYRGYDSAGIAVLGHNGALRVEKRQGKLAALETALSELPAGDAGIGHTRWATHGPPTAPNAHPHTDCHDQIAVVHNGIIENYATLRRELAAAGHTLKSDTDSEVIAHLVEAALDEAAPVQGAPHVAHDAAAGRDGTSPALHEEAFVAAVRAALGRLQGAYALVVVSSRAPGVLVAARRHSPLVLGNGAGQAYVASDIPALLGLTRHVHPLADDHVAVLRGDGILVLDGAGNAVEIAYIDVDWDDEAVGKGGYDHFVLKEIHEQPLALRRTLGGRVSAEGISLPELDALDVPALSRAYFVAAGTSHYAGLVAKRLIERWARLPVEVAIASEFRYGHPVLDATTLVVLVTQSGETADTLAAQRMAAEAGAPTLAVTNVVGSSVTRAADTTLYLQVGPEIGVVATKTFTGQLALLTALAAELGVRRGTLEASEARAIARALTAVPDAVAEAVGRADDVAGIVATLADRSSVLFIGRGLGYPIAMEAALKLKEISYIHAEGYPAGELKHGPIALIEPGVPVVAIAPAGSGRAKTVSSIEEVRARGARVVAFASDGDAAMGSLADDVVWMPAVSEFVGPLVWVVPAQLLAYHTAVRLGHDVDQPRNLAKSVTVE